jgi:hypothetical protein
MAQAAIATESAQDEHVNIDANEPETINIPKGGRPKGSGRRKETPESEQQSFFEYTSGLTDADWENHVMYVYQWAPIVDLTRGGTEKKYRRIYNSHKSQEDIKRDLGSGTYQLKLNRIQPETRKERPCKEIVISILDYDFPPNIPPGVWLDDTRNGDWAWARPLLEKKFNTRPGSANGGSAPTWAEMMQFIQANNHREPGAKDQLMSSVVSILPQLLQQQTNAQDPGKVITALKEAKDFITPAAAPDQTAPLVTLLTTLLPLITQKPDNTMLTFVMTQLTESQKQNSLLMSKLIDYKAEERKQPSPMDQVKQMAEVMTTVAGIMPQPSNMEPWQQVLVETVPKATEMIQTLVATNALRNRAPIPGQRPPVGQPIQQTAPQTVTAPPAQVNVGTPPPQSAAPQPAQPTEGAIPEMDIMTKTLFVAIADNAAAALKLGMPGDEFAERVCDNFGARTYDNFVEGNPRETLLPIFQSIPEAWQLLGPFEALLPKFLEEFYAYAETPEDEMEAATTSPVPVSATPPKKPRSKKAAAGAQ